MAVIDVKVIEEAVYNLCYQANICLTDKVYSKILDAYKNGNDNKDVLGLILENARVACETKNPLCQDTGQVLIFLNIGQNVQISGSDLSCAINEAVEKCYMENFFRKSVVEDALFNRKNTNTNTPAIIYTEIVPGDKIFIDVLLKGAGSENKSKSEMLLPTSSKEDVKKFISDCVISSGLNSCPPLFVGVGIGGTIDKSAILAKRALITDENSIRNKAFAQEVKDYINSLCHNEFSQNYVLDLNILTMPTHIACMPVSVSINCHSSRKARCIISASGVEYFEDKVSAFIKIDDCNSKKIEINTNEIEKIRNLKENDEILLSGEIYVARDAAHLRLIELLEKHENLPIKIKDGIIFYAGPCPAKPNTVIGSIGPTTASRMDDFTPVLYEKGLLATIGKGGRNDAVKKSIKDNKGVYFSAIGGIAGLLSERIRTSQIIAFEDLGAEAIYKLTIDKFPLKVSISSNA